MKILLSYSKAHYDPTKQPHEQQYWGSSASILARTLYKLLEELGDVTYVDMRDYESVAGKEFDLFVGVAVTFTKFLASCRAKRSILIAVNMHPTERNSLLMGQVRDNNLPLSSLCDWDLVDEQEMGDGLRQADHILAVGNMAIYNSYIKHGVPRNKIKTVNYAIDETLIEKSQALPKSNKSKQLVNYLYTTSEIGLRKGFDSLAAMFTNLADQKEPFCLHIIGKPTNELYEKKLAQLQQLLGDRLVVHGWINSQDKQYGELVSSCDYLVFPSVEEGQAGSVLDAISRGVIPLVTANAGIDFSPLGYLETAVVSEHNAVILKQSISLTADERTDWRKKTLAYYHECHSGFVTAFREALADCLTGYTYPKVSIVLAIFNKQDTIIPLIKLLDRALKLYGNVEMHVIFDGCKDKTEPRVRNFFAHHTAYPVTFAVTPNIFEVKSNNIGLKKSTGKYGVIIQDDNYVYDENFLFEAVNFLDKNPTAAILGGLAGVNYYPRGTKNLEGPGAKAMSAQEVYWRQDQHTDPALAHRIFQVDACMRGPLFLRKSYLEEYGYLDEIYAPLYQDDMDLCFQAASHGYKTYCVLIDVENRSMTMGEYNAKQAKFFSDIIKRNTDIFYKRWKPTTDKKDYSWLQRIPIGTYGPLVPWQQQRDRLTRIAYGKMMTARRLVKKYRNLGDAIWKRLTTKGQR